MDKYKESNKFFEDEFRCTTISSSNKIVQITIGKYDFLEPPFFNIFLKSLETIDGVDLIFFIDGEASFRMSYPFFLFGFEKNLKDINHAASIEDSTVFREEFS